MSTTAEDVNATIDHALESYAESLEIVKVGIIENAGRETFPALDAMHDAYKRMAGLARLSVAS